MPQIELFAPDPVAPRRIGMPMGVERRWNLAQSPKVVEEVLKVFHQHHGEWLDGRSHFQHIIERHNISFCFGHVVARIARENYIKDRRVYFGKGVGAERPGSPNYQGFGVEYRFDGTETEGAPRAQEA